MKKAPAKKAKKKAKGEPRPMGRPQFKVNAATRQRVERLVSCQMSHQDIARAIGCSSPTLRLHFEEELATGAARKRARIIDLLYVSAEGGNVSALRKLVSMTPGADVNDPNMKFSSTKYDDDLDIEDRPKHNKRYAPKQGKKERQQEDAESITGTFAPPDAPDKIIN